MESTVLQEDQAIVGSEVHLVAVLPSPKSGATVSVDRLIVTCAEERRRDRQTETGRKTDRHGYTFSIRSWFEKSELEIFGLRRE